MNDLKHHPINLKEIFLAEGVIRPYLKETSLTYYKGLSDLIGAEIYIKHENHNRGGSFKIRGGLNLMKHLKDKEIKGVVTFTTGNHGISVALSASLYGILATVVVPEGNNKAKNEMIKNAGARLIEAGSNFEEAAQVVEKLSQEESLYFIHAANEPHLINGVGTEFLEILREMPDVDVLLVPIGAGSELAAATVVFKQLKPSAQIIAVQAEASKAAYLSWKNQKIVSSTNQTFAGGFATGSGYEVPFNIYKDHLSDFILLTEEEIIEGMQLAMTYTRNLAEGAGAATLIGAYKIKERLKNKKVVLQMSGCNTDLNILKNVLSRL